jgi:hypothetical protein
MDTRTAFKEFILEFIPISYSLSPKHSCEIRHFAEVLQLVFKKKFEMELPKGSGFYLDILREIGYPLKFELPEDYFRKRTEKDFNMIGNSVRVQCSPKVVRELKYAIYDYTGMPTDKVAAGNSLREQMELFRERLERLP